jgi:hypothetical protein
MKQIIKRTIASFLLILVVFISGLITLICFPQNLFANKIEHQKFRIYYDGEIDKGGLTSRLDNAYRLIEYSELHDKNFVFNIFLAHDNFFNKIEDLQGKGPIARATAGNITVKKPIEIENNLIKSSRSNANLTEIIVHEMVHNLQGNKYGLLNFSPIKHPPMWKLEGYPEYISRRNLLKSGTYSLGFEIGRFVELEKNSKDGFVEVVKGHFMPTYYYKGRLMVEYLIDIKGLTYDEILKDKRTETEVFDELLNWVKSQK